MYAFFHVVAIVELLGGLAGIGAVGLHYFVRGAAWPPAYLLSSLAFYLVVMSAGYRLLMGLGGGRQLSALVQIAQAKAWTVGAHAIDLLAGPLVLFEWRRGILQVSAGGGALVQVSPAPASSSGPPPDLSWATTVIETESALLPTSSFNLAAMLAALALVAILLKGEKRSLLG